MILVLGEDADCFASALGQHAEGELVEEATEVGDRVQYRLGRAIDAQEAQLALDGVPVIGGVRQLRLLVRAPPDEAVAVIRPEREEAGANEIGRDLLAGNHRAQGADLLAEARLPPDIGVVARLRGAVQDGADGVHRVLVAVRREDRVGVGAEEIGELRLIRDAPCAGGREAVHPGDHGARGIGGADGIGDGRRPDVGLLSGGAGHAVALIPQVPADNGGVCFEVADELANETHLPLDGDGIGEDVQALERRGKVQATRHPPREQTDEELQAILLRQVQGGGELLHRLMREACLPEGIIRKRVLPMSELDRTPAPTAQEVDRLEIGPEGKDAQELQSGVAEEAEVAFHDLRVPFGPHARACVRGPVIAPDDELARLRQIDLHLHPHVNPPSDNAIRVRRAPESQE